MELFAVGYVYFMSMLLVTMFECCRVYIFKSVVGLFYLFFLLILRLGVAYTLNHGGSPCDMIMEL